MVYAYGFLVPRGRRLRLHLDGSGEPVQLWMAPEEVAGDGVGWLWGGPWDPRICGLPSGYVKIAIEHDHS